MRTVIFAHGLEGRPDGRKPSALRSAGLEVIAPDGRGQQLATRIAGLEGALAGRRDVVLVAASDGAAAAAVVAALHPDRLAGLVLLAPALLRLGPPLLEPDDLVLPATLPTTIVHATADDVVPVEVSRALARRCPHARLVEVDDHHDLHAALGAIVEIVKRHASA
jgi:pimeloyl-ACP methyl ester carboxylesterase